MNAALAANAVLPTLRTRTCHKKTAMKLRGDVKIRNSRSYKIALIRVINTCHHDEEYPTASSRRLLHSLSPRHPWEPIDIHTCRRYCTHRVTQSIERRSSRCNNSNSDLNPLSGSKTATHRGRCSAPVCVQNENTNLTNEVGCSHPIIS